MADERVSTLRPDTVVQAVIGMNGSPAAEPSEGASRRSVVLVTGMSGTGKSTVLTELRRRGHRVIDTTIPVGA
jgi:adenylylsulfate kinase-like enzyme